MVSELRNYIRHPSSIPILFSVEGGKQKQPLKNVGQGGLSFVAESRLKAGEIIHIKIESCHPAFEAEGVVRWCRPFNKRFLVGVAFQDKTTHFAIRMVEQVCHIEAYRQEVKDKTGVVLTSEQAAIDWIEKHAASFPKLHG